tara:strand:- start:93 stop:398 length:306 start_codon:yes stop_codon:yes gene_type:complete
MNLIPGIQRITGDAQIGPVGTVSVPKPIRLFSVSLISGASASTLTLRDGTSTGATANEQVDGNASQSVTKNYAGGLRFPNGLFADADANISYATFSFTEEC